MSIKERAALTIAAGYRAFRMDAASLGRGNAAYNTRERVLQVYEDARRRAKASARTATGASISTSAST